MWEAQQHAHAAAQQQCWAWHQQLQLWAAPAQLTRSNLCGPGSASMPCWHRLKQPRSSNRLIHGLHRLSLFKQRRSSNRLSSGMNRLRLHRFSLNRLEGLHSQIKLL